MPERRFETAYWSDPFVMKLSAEAKLLYAYLWTNLHCNQAGLYEIAPETISFETGLALEEVPELLCSLEPKVTWFPEQNLVWVKNFLRHQTKSPQFLVAAAKCLQSINNNGLAKEFLEYNQRYNLSIPYQYPIDRESISDSDTLPLPYTSADTLVKEGVSLFGSFSLLRNRLVKAVSGAVDRLVEHEMIKQEITLMGRDLGLAPRSEYQTESGRVDLCFLGCQGELAAAFEVDIHEPKAKSLAKLTALDCPFKCIILRTGITPYSKEQDIHLVGLGIGQDVEETTPASESENGESLSPGDREVISVWRSVKGFKMSSSAAAELVAKLRTKFPGVDILVESEKWAARKLSEPLDKKARPSGQIYNFMGNRHKWNQEKKGGADGADKRHSGSGKPEGKWDASKPVGAFSDLEDDYILPGMRRETAMDIAEGRREANAVNTRRAQDELRRRGIPFKEGKIE